MLFPLLLHIPKQSPRFHDLVLEVADGVAVKFLVAGQITDRTGVEVDFQLIAVFDPAVVDGVGQSFDEQHGIAIVDGVAVVNARTGFGEDAGDSRVFEAIDGVLAAGSAAEVLAGDDEVARSCLFGEVLLPGIVFESVLGHLLGVGLGQVFIVIDQVGVDVVVENPGASGQFAHVHSSCPRMSRGSVMRPRTALAMAVMGLVR